MKTSDKSLITVSLIGYIVSVLGAAQSICLGQSLFYLVLAIVSTAGIVQYGFGRE